jgi:hypothetical protein
MIRTDEYVLRVDTLADALREKWLDVVLAGPELVGKTATKVEAASRAVAWQVVELSDVVSTEEEEASAFTQAARAVRELATGMDEFIEAAQSALDDDGTEP